MYIGDFFGPGFPVIIEYDQREFISAVYARALQIKRIEYPAIRERLFIEWGRARVNGVSR